MLSRTSSTTYWYAYSDMKGYIKSYINNFILFFVFLLT